MNKCSNVLSASNESDSSSIDESQLLFANSQWMLYSVTSALKDSFFVYSDM